MTRLIGYIPRDWHLVRVWKGADRHFERRLKNAKHSWKFCPVCNPDHALLNMDPDKLGRKEDLCSSPS